jgi:hypothetical protein
MQEALDFERDRAQAIEDQIALTVCEVEGPQIDAAAFAAMSPEDVEIVQAELNPPPYGSDEGPEYFERDDLIDLDFEEPGDPHAEELTRLNRELEDCRRRQQAFESYLEALEG